jgi:hypothetical protein
MHHALQWYVGLFNNTNVVCPNQLGIPQGLPMGSTLKVFSGPNLLEQNLVEDGVIDSECMTPWQVNKKAKKTQKKRI